MSGRGQIEPRWNAGESGNPNGRPKGSKNRSTIARYWLEAIEKAENPITGEMQALTQEDLITLAQIKKAKLEADTASYKALMDSAFGAPIQQVESEQNVTIKEFDIKKVVGFGTPKPEI